MRIVTTVADLRAAVADARAAGPDIGFVPTMGAFHDGHLALMRAAREACGFVVVSIFVNPAQFGPGEDLAAYPRDLEDDAALAAGARVDLLFAPAVEEVYPAGFATTVHVDGLSDVLEGEVRGPGHFDGVCTVVAKLLNMAGPDVAFFGQKDAQQAAVVRRMVRDLDLPTRIEVLPTVREPDGLAMSSRNRYLAPAERERAVALVAGLRAAADQVAAGARDAATIRAAAVAAMAAHGVEPEYLALVDPDTFSPVERLDRPTLAAVAARVGPARLIDNLLLSPNGVAAP